MILEHLMRRCFLGAVFLVAFPWEASELGLPARSSVYACRSFPGFLSQQNQRLTPLPLPCLQEFGCSFSCPRLANTEKGVRGSSHDGREKKAKPKQPTLHGEWQCFEDTEKLSGVGREQHWAVGLLCSSSLFCNHQSWRSRCHSGREEGGEMKMWLWMLLMTKMNMWHSFSRPA